MAANNDTFLQSLRDIHQAKLPDVSFNPKESRIQCFPHVINTCVQHTIKALNNGVDTDSDSDKGSDDESNEGSDGDSEDSDEESDGDDDGGGGGGGGGDDSDEDVVVPGDPLNKIRALVRGIRASGQRQEQFANVILGGNQFGWWKDIQGNAVSIERRQLLRDVKTRWDSTYQMLVRVREFRQVSLLL
jgi:hypothetical protein